MAYEIVPKDRFKKKVIKILEFLEKEWSHKVAQEFLKRLIRN
jgi:hypothetical protein